MNTAALEGLGLTKNEARVYIVLLELGSGSVTQITQRVGLHRPVVYDLLERLEEKGLVGSVYQGKKKYFEAMNPQKLVELEKERQEKLNAILPHLLELSNAKKQLNVRVYKGKEGLKAVFDNVLKVQPSEWLVIGASGSTANTIPYYLSQFHKRRVKQKIAARGLMINNPTGRKRASELIHLHLTRIKYLPKTIVTPTVIQIYGNRTVLHSNTSETPFVIVIDNEDIASSFKEYFEALWKISHV